MLIGISGVAGSGKDTVADFIVQHGGFAKVALADPLKRAARDLYAFTDDQLWGPSSARNAPDKRYPREHTWHTQDTDEFTVAYPTCLCCGASAADERSQCYLTPRYALQHLGTEHGRHCYPDVWIECALRRARTLANGSFDYEQANGLIAEFAASPKHVVVPDLRFKNELDAFRTAGAKLIRVVRPGAGLGGSAGRHASEAEQESTPDSAFDAVIVNDGSLEDLRQSAVAAACGRCIAGHR